MTTIKRNCPHCGGPLVLLISLGQKVCSDCRKIIPWPLSEGQEPIFGGKHDV